MTTPMKAHKPKDTCDTCTLSQICAYIPPHQHGACKLTNIVDHRLTLKRKELLYSYRDAFKCTYVVQSGAIKTFQIDMNGQERILSFYLPGEIIGLEAIQPGFYPYSAIALIPSQVCEIPFDHLLDFTAAFPTLLPHLVKTLAERISHGHYVTAPAAEQRLAAFILDMAQRLNPHGQEKEFDLPMSRYDIGNYLGLAPETISRIFTRFQQANYIQVQNKKIVICKPSSLQWIAQDGVHTQECNH